MITAVMHDIRFRANSKRSPEDFGYAPFYGWSEDKARQATQAEGQGFSRYLGARGLHLRLTTLARPPWKRTCQRTHISAAAG